MTRRPGARLPDEWPSELPEGLVHDRTTATFDEATVPAGLLRSHRVAEGVWGRLVVRSGTVTFVAEDTGQRIALAAGGSVVIPPGRRHHVEPAGPATFAVEFHRRRDHGPGATAGGG